MTRLSERSDIKDVLLAQDGIPIPLTKRMSALCNLVRVVFQICSEEKVMGVTATRVVASVTDNQLTIYWSVR